MVSTKAEIRRCDSVEMVDSDRPKNSEVTGLKCLDVTGLKCLDVTGLKCIIVIGLRAQR